jgi:hypothetical protein
VQASQKPTVKTRDSLVQQVRQHGFSFCASANMQAWLLAQDAQALADWPAFVASWDGMPLDQYMADGGRYRRRRYAVFSANRQGEIQLEQHQPHYQSLDYNRLNGGVARHFEAIPRAIAQGATLQNTLAFCHHIFSRLYQQQTGNIHPWHIEVHQFRIESIQAQQGKPTPEGVHRDGVDFVFVMMVKRENISSGTTTMQDLTQQTLDSFTLTDPLDVAIVDDHRCMHGVTPIQPIDPNQPAFRDVLVVTFRALPPA